MWGRVGPGAFGIGACVGFGVGGVCEGFVGGGVGEAEVGIGVWAGSVDDGAFERGGWVVLVTVLVRTIWSIGS